MSKDECVELKNINYKNMLLNKNLISFNETMDNSLDDYLNMEKKSDENKPWAKLEKATKLKKIVQYIKNKKTSHKKELKQYLFQCLERKKLQREKDVIYDISLGKITDIPGLKFIKKKNKYTLKSVDYKGTTLKNLAPKRRRKKVKIDIKDK